MLSRLTGALRRDFSSLSEQEILALAISSEEDDGRIYLAYAEFLRENYPGSAAIFEEMAAEEDGHRRRLIDLYRKRFGERILLIRRDHVRGYYERRPLWLAKTLSIDAIRSEAERMEAQAARFYREAAKRTQDAATRKLLGDLAQEEEKHETKALLLAAEHAPDDVREKESKQERRQMILTYIQPGLAGLMDGSVSTLAPIFAAAFATGDTWQTFLVGLAASVGAGISMGFTEVASDDGVISGRGAPIKRGFATGIMTTLGGLGHALPYLIPHFYTATAIAIVLVVCELWAISWIQHRFMETPWSRAIFQVVLGGALVFAAGLAIGTA
ncbi:MAG: membrane protein [Rhizobiaceae bacterium MnEN-MB40S]|nr:MAG: membrane protein [Rhizobiaceae bacterium MnEN-MB40S]